MEFTSKKCISFIFLFLPFTALSDVTDDNVFAYGEANYPELFSGQHVSGQNSPYLYRYYPESDNYLGINTDNASIYLLGSATNNELMLVGKVGDFLPSINHWLEVQSREQVGGSRQNKPLQVTGKTTDISTVTWSSGVWASGIVWPAGITTDGTNLYCVNPSMTVNGLESGNRVFRINLATNEISIFVGSGVTGTKDGFGQEAEFDNPYYITTDGNYLYVADLSALKKIDIATREVTTITNDINSPITVVGNNLYFAKDHALYEMNMLSGV